MAKQSSVNLDITNNADGFDISGGTTVRKLGITGGDVTIAGSGSAVVTFPTTSTTIAGLGITQSFSALQSFSAGISASGGVTLSGYLSGTTAGFQFGFPTGASGYIQYVPAAYPSGGLLLTGSQIFQVGNAPIASGSGFLNVDPNAEKMIFSGRTEFYVNQGYQSAVSPLSIAIGTAQTGQPIRIAKQSTTGSIDTARIIAGCDPNGIWYGLGFSGGTGGATFSGNVAMTSTSSHTGLASFAGGISASGATFSGGVNILGGFTAGAGSGNSFMAYIPSTSSANGGLWIQNGNFQIGGSIFGAGNGVFGCFPNSEFFQIYGQQFINKSFNYQAGSAVLRLNAGPAQSVPIFAAYKQTAEGTVITSTYTATNMVAGIDQNGALFSTAGVSAAGGVTFTNNVQANGYILTSNARSWFI